MIINGAAFLFLLQILHWRHLETWLISVCWTCTLKLLISLISSNSFLVDSLGFSMYDIILSVNRDNFTPCLLALATTSGTMLNSNGQREHPCFVPELRKTQSFTIEYDVSCAFFIITLHRVEESLFFFFFNISLIYLRERGKPSSCPSPTWVKTHALPSPKQPALCSVPATLCPARRLQTPRCPQYPHGAQPHRAWPCLCWRALHRQPGWAHLLLQAAESSHHRLSCAMLHWSS